MNYNSITVTIGLSLKRLAADSPLLGVVTPIHLAASVFPDLLPFPVPVFLFLLASTLSATQVPVFAIPGPVFSTLCFMCIRSGISE